jgi:hypothetical protein
VYFVPPLIFGVAKYLLHYSIVWALTDGVDVVAHNAARPSLSLRTGELRLFMALWRCC